MWRMIWRVAENGKQTEETSGTIEAAGRYMETYPADSTYYEMERILGESYFRKGDYQQAIKYK